MLSLGIKYLGVELIHMIYILNQLTSTEPFAATAWASGRIHSQIATAMRRVLFRRAGEGAIVARRKIVSCY